MYQPAHYNTVLDAVVREYNLNPNTVSPQQWIIWRKQIKNLFDKNILIAEILQALDGASNKKQWPLGTALFHRIEDVVLLTRRESRNTKTDGMYSLKDLLH